MRIAFLSDTHGNYPALQAALTDLKTQGPDQIVFLGDAATLGPNPAETLDALRALDCVYIQGNHDEAILFPQRALELQIGVHLHNALDWASQRLSTADLEFIRSFRATYELETGAGDSILCFHGSPRANTDVLLATTNGDRLDELFADTSASVWIGGHTHVPLYRRYGAKLLLNSGSIGNAFKHAYVAGIVPELLPWAEYLLLDVDGRSLRADIRRVPFDAQEVLRLMAASKNPSASWWLEQYR
ncbi:MAG: hypothetical protein HFACDABA_02650 [Anaerolineales bacterium]|nr:hypothetical protein [Anaerolineales bacterium]